MSLYFETGYACLKKYGEELCGDSMELVRSEGGLIAVMSDGLGSGVKANILSTLTSRIAVTMLQQGMQLEQVVETVGATLPVCKVRKLAYSTFSIVKVLPDGTAYLAEYDNPALCFIRDGVLIEPDRKERFLEGKVIREAHLQLREGDWLISVSDGGVNAGIGGIWNLGWSWERVAHYLERRSAETADAQELADDFCAVCDKLYGGRPGDDTTILALRVRAKRRAFVMVGPPSDPAQDVAVVNELLAGEGEKIVCGGTTGNLVARELGAEVEVDLASAAPGVPPMGIIEGIDLVTEGVLTLTGVRDRLKAGVSARQLRYGVDGISRLAGAMLRADELRIKVGMAVNPAHQNAQMPQELAFKFQIIKEIGQLLEARGKTVRVEYV